MSMDRTMIESDRRAFLESFFSEGNRIRWAMLDGPNAIAVVKEKVQPFIDEFLEGQDSVLLPRSMNDGSVYWYGMARTESSFRSLRMEIQAFIGMTYSDYMGSPAALNQEDKIDSLVMSIFQGRVIRFHVPPEHHEAVRAKLAQRSTLLVSRPSRKERIVLPTGRMIRDLEEMIRFGDLQRGQVKLREISHLGRLDAPNQLFLEILLFEGAGLWGKIYNHKRLDDLLNIEK